MKKITVVFVLMSIIVMVHGGQSIFAYNELDFGRLLRTGNCRKCNLDGAPLSGANLTGSDLRGSSIRGANLQKATLYKASLPSPRMYIGTNFTGAMWVDGGICRSGSISKCVCHKGDWSDPKLDAGRE